jgi:hypothetical protein
MTTPSRPTHDRIELARTRRMIEDTAVAAVPGATLEHLAADAGSPDRWTAELRSADGRRLTLRLDRRLETVEVVPALALAYAA